MRHSSDQVAIDLIALAIVRHEDKIVLVQQRLSDGVAPTWVIPGGLVEAGELVSEALVREVREEAGVHVEEVGHLACVMQIDRPVHHAQTLAYFFEVAKWHGELGVHDPDNEVLAVELVSLVDVITRLQSNGGWPCIQTPLIAYLKREMAAGAFWLYREDVKGQHLIARMPK